MKIINAKSRAGVISEIIVDDDDFDHLSKFTWRVQGINGVKYASRCVTASDQESLKYPTSVKMHREIMGIVLQRDKVVDHINHDGLDNRKVNLRVCDGYQNQGNRRKKKLCASKYKGVCWGYKKWRAYIKTAGKRIELGSFLLEDDAARAYNEAAVKYFGEYAHLNVILNK